MGLGTLLEKARLKQGLTIEEMSDRTKIRPQFLQAIEGDNYHLLPGEAYVKPFIRTYAKALGLNDEILSADKDVGISRFTEEPASVSEEVVAGQSIRERRERARRARRRRFILRLILTLAIIIGSLYLTIRLMNV